MIEANSTKVHVAASWAMRPYTIRLIRNGVTEWLLQTLRGEQEVTRKVFLDVNAAFRAFQAEQRKRETEIALARAPKHSAPLFAPIQKELQL